MPMGSGSGGKIEKRRRRRRRPTPYDRPDAPSKPPERSGWLGGFVLPATRRIASGAGNFLLSVFGSDSSSSSDSDSSLDDELDGDSDNLDIDFQGSGGCSDITNSRVPSCGKFSYEKNDAKHQIMHLIMKETFTREESNNLIRIINSRTVEGSIVGEDVLDVHKKAVFEAKKWLEHKKSGSGLNAEKDKGAHILGTSILPSASRVDISPVDVAKSYMQGRSMTSPLAKVDFSTPSPNSLLDYKQEQIHPVVGSSLATSELKNDPSTNGSWNIEEEIRNLRSRAAEDMLKSCPSTNIHWSSFSTEQDTTTNPSSADCKDNGINHNPDKHVEVACELLSETLLEIPVDGGDVPAPDGPIEVDTIPASPPKSGDKSKHRRGRKPGRYYKKTRARND